MSEYWQGTRRVEREKFNVFPLILTGRKIGDVRPYVSIELSYDLVNQLWRTITFTGKKCQRLSGPENGKITPSKCESNPWHGDTCVRTCDRGYKPDGSRYIQCDNGQWSNTAGFQCRGNAILSGFFFVWFLFFAIFVLCLQCDENLLNSIPSKGGYLNLS